LSNGAGLRLIEVSAVLFAVLNGRAQKKMHRPHPDKTVSSDTALRPYE
jgi:hypothetical protein